MLNKKNIITVLATIASMIAFLSLGMLHCTKAIASVPASSYSSKILKKNGFTKNEIPKKYRGTWYSYQRAYNESPASMDTLKITKTKFDGSKVKVAKKLVKIDGKYRLPVYANQQLTYLSFSNKKNKKLTYSFVAPIISKNNKINKKKITRDITFDQPYFTSKKQAKNHPFSS